MVVPLLSCPSEQKFHLRLLLKLLAWDKWLAFLSSLPFNKQDRVISDFCFQEYLPEESQERSQMLRQLKKAAFPRLGSGLALSFNVLQMFLQGMRVEERSVRGPVKRDLADSGTEM